MTGRLIGAIISTIIYELLLAALVLWGLPRLGINIPWFELALLMLALAAVSTFTYRKGSQALRKREVAGLPGMVGSLARVVSPLNPEGTVKIKGELWSAISDGGVIKAGEEVIVIGQERLRLIVRRKP